MRGSITDALHAASVAVVNERGELTHSFGDPNRSFALRSATKPFQALPLVTSGALDAFALGERELAIACASHDGSDAHVDIVKSVLERAGATVRALRCGSHLPIGMRVRHESPTLGEDKDPLRHNCSGKHAGFLLVSRHLGEPFEAYLEPESRVQTLVREAVSKACDVSSGELATAVDGCSAPTFALPLVTFARGMKNLALARSDDSDLARALARVRNAMLKAPELVSGEGRLDYDLARSFTNNVVNKSGAEAIIGIGFSDPPLGIVVKVHDGAERALGAITLAVLRELGIVDDLARFPSLARHERPAVTNHAHLRTGDIVASVALVRERA